MLKISKAFVGNSTVLISCKPYMVGGAVSPSFPKKNEWQCKVVTTKSAGNYPFLFARNCS